MAKYSFDWTCIVFSRGHRSKFTWSCSSANWTYAIITISFYFQTLDGLLSDIQLLAEQYESQSKNDHDSSTSYESFKNSLPESNAPYDYRNSISESPAPYDEPREPLALRRPKRIPIFSTWLQRRRSAPAEPPAQETTEFKGPAASKFTELDNAIRKVQMWEAALHRRFGDRFRDTPENLAMNPVWVKVMKLRAMLRRLKAMAEARTRGLDTTRMRKKR